MNVTVDSELIQVSYECLQTCSCTMAAILITKHFHENEAPVEVVHQADIRQKKGEAEKSQVD